MRSFEEIFWFIIILYIFLINLNNWIDNNVFSCVVKKKCVYYFYRLRVDLEVDCKFMELGEVNK